MDEVSAEPQFCKFRLLDAVDADAHPALIGDLLSGSIDGLVGRGLFTGEEVSVVLKRLEDIHDRDWMPTPFGRNFPLPFAVINDKGASLDGYYERLGKLHRMIDSDEKISMMFQRLEQFLRKVGAEFNVSVPQNNVKHQTVVPGTFRFMMPELGGLFIHCGNLFQRQSEFFYSMLESNVDMDNQLSYFIVLQNPESGGELTLYDMFWEDVQKKDHPENNEYVIGMDGERIYVRDLPKAQVRPEAGDILIFHGGPIWHRVEDIRGSIPRVTLGGFLNFSKDRKNLFYWS